MVTRFKAHAVTSKSTMADEVHNELLLKFASVDSVIAKLGLNRVAGNVYECPSTRDFWEVKNGKIMRLTSENEVDNNETLTAADHMNPEASLQQILADLTFYD